MNLLRHIRKNLHVRQSEIEESFGNVFAVTVLLELEKDGLVKMKRIQECKNGWPQRDYLFSITKKGMKVLLLSKGKTR